MDIRERLKELMGSKNISIGYIATATGLAKSTISMWLKNNYNGDNAKVADKLHNFVQRENERTNNDLPFVDISISKYVFEIARLCHTQGRIGVCVGQAGLGKTVAAKKYTKKYMDAILIESDFGYTAKSLLREICIRLGLSVKSSTSAYDLMNEVVTKLNQSGRLLIIDEAENLAYRALEITRRIHDKTGVGILLVGRSILLQNLTGQNYQYDQLYSRVEYPKVLDKLSIQDIIKILESVGQEASLAETYLQFSGGNTRKLEHLISHSISIAKINGKAAVDDAVIRKTSELLMA